LGSNPREIYMEKTYPPGAFRSETAPCLALRCPVESVMNSSLTLVQPPEALLHGTHVRPT
jgi:hypothetical protein